MTSGCVLFLYRKVNSFLNKMNPTEVQMASYIDTMREKQWPGFQPAAPPPPRTDEEKNESRERAHNLINARCRSNLSAPVKNQKKSSYFWLLIIHLKCIFIFSVDSNYLILKKTDMEAVFNLFQDREENKTLVYVSILRFMSCHHFLICCISLLFKTT